MRSLSMLGLSVALLACAQSRSNVRRLNPPTLSSPKGYTHVVTVSGGRTIYISGEVAIDKEGKVVGVGDLTAQSRQVFENIKAALTAANATMADVVKINLYLLDATQVNKFRDVRNEYFPSDPPASTAVEVRALLRPEALLEVDAIAVVPE